MCEEDQHAVPHKRKTSVKDTTASETDVYEIQWLTENILSLFNFMCNTIEQWILSPWSTFVNPHK